MAKPILTRNDLTLSASFYKPTFDNEAYHPALWNRITGQVFYWPNITNATPAVAILIAADSLERALELANNHMAEWNIYSAEI